MAARVGAAAGLVAGAAEVTAARGRTAGKAVGREAVDPAKAAEAVAATTAAKVAAASVATAAAVEMAQVIQAAAEVEAAMGAWAGVTARVALELVAVAEVGTASASRTMHGIRSPVSRTPTAQTDRTRPRRRNFRHTMRSSRSHRAVHSYPAESVVRSSGTASD